MLTDEALIEQAKIEIGDFDHWGKPVSASTYREVLRRFTTTVERDREIKERAKEIADAAKETTRITSEDLAFQFTV